MYKHKPRRGDIIIDEIILAQKLIFTINPEGVTLNPSNKNHSSNGISNDPDNPLFC